MLIGNLAIANNYDQACIERVTDVFTKFGYHNPGNPNKSQVEVILVPEVAIEFELEQYFTKGFRQEIDARGVKNYQFILKKNLCDPYLQVPMRDGTNQRMNPESLALLQIFEHSYPEFSANNRRQYAEHTAELRNRLFQKGLVNEYANASDIEKERLETMRKYLPTIFDDLSQVNPTLEEIAKKRFEAFRKDGPTWKWETAGDGLSKIAQRIKDSTIQANISACYGTEFANPDPDSVKRNACLSFYSMNDVMKILMEENNIPESLRDSLVVENFSGGNIFSSKNIALEQINTFSLKLGDDKNVELFLRNSIQKFTDLKKGCLQNTHCQQYNYTSGGFRFNATNRAKSNNNAYFEIDLVKWSNNARFEANVIKQTSEDNPHWPMLKKMKPVDSANPGLLLGYILRVGFTATVLDEVPQFLPFLANIFGDKANKSGKLEFISEAEYQGSTPGTDDADTISIELGARLRFPNFFVLGFKVTHNAEMNHQDVAFTEPGKRRSVSTSMVYLTVPLKEIDGLDNATPEAPAPSDLKLVTLQPFYRLFPLGRAYHFNYKEFENKTSEEGVRGVVKWNRFTADVSIFNTTGRATRFAAQPNDFLTADALVKYTPDSAPRLNFVFAAKADTAKDGHQQLGLGLELLPLRYTPAEKLIDLSIIGLFYPHSNYGAFTRTDAVRAMNPNIPYERFGSLDISAERKIAVPWVTEKLGVQGKLGFYSSIYINKGFEAGYFSLAARAAVQSDKYCFELGFTAYNQDGNFGVGSDRRADDAKGKGQLGPHHQGYTYALLDGICGYKLVNSLFSGVPIKENKLEEDVVPNKTDPDTQKLAELEVQEADKNQPQFNERDIPTADRDQEKTLSWLAAIATAWYRNEVTTDLAKKNLKMVPLLVSRLAEKLMNGGLHNLKKGHPLLAAEKFEAVRQIYDPRIKLSELVPTNDPLAQHLQWILRFNFSRDPRWKESIISGDASAQLFENASFCGGVSMEMLGDQSVANALMATGRDNGFCRRNPGALTVLAASEGPEQMSAALSNLTLEFLNEGKKRLQSSRVDQAREYFELIVESLDGEKGSEKKYTRDYYLVNGFQNFIKNEPSASLMLQALKERNNLIYGEAQYCLSVIYAAKNKPAIANEHMAKIGDYKPPGTIANLINSWVNLNHCMVPETK